MPPRFSQTQPLAHSRAHSRAKGRLLKAARTAALGLLVIGFGLMEHRAYGLAANKVWFKELAPGRYRIYVNVTIPELKEFREYHVDFRSYRKAAEYFWQLVKGADFYPPSKTRFQQKPAEGYQPW